MMMMMMMMMMMIFLSSKSVTLNHQLIGKSTVLLLLKFDFTLGSIQAGETLRLLQFSINIHKYNCKNNIKN